MAGPAAGDAPFSLSCCRGIQYERSSIGSAGEQTMTSEKDTGCAIIFVDGHADFQRFCAGLLECGVKSGGTRKLR